MKKLTISIVNYNAGDYLLNCLESLRKVKNELEFDVYVVDNGSNDGSFENAQKKYKEFKFINNASNLGFGKAHNLVLKNLKTPYVLTLNPDCEVMPGSLKYVFEFMEKNSEVGVSSCRVEKSDGTLDKASHRGFPTPLASLMYFVFKNDRLYHLTNKNMNEPHEVDSVVGAFMFIRKNALDKVGNFDEDYFLYGEDIDLCYRIKENGFKIFYIPNVKVIHIKGVSSGIKKHSQLASKASEETRINSRKYFFETMKIFYKKHYEKKYPFFVNYIVYLGINMKLFQTKIKKSV